MPDCRVTSVERAVAVVPEQLHEPRRQAARPAVHGHSLPGAVGVLAGPGQLLERRVEIVGDAQVEVSVAVVVHPGAAGAVAHGVLAKPGLLRHVGECAVAVVAVQHVVAVVGHKQIVEPVVVVVAHGDGRGPAGADEAGLRRDVGKRAVAVVLVQAVGRARRRALQAGAVEHEQIRPPVVVVVDERDAAADDFDDVALRLDAAVDDRIGQAGLLWRRP